MKILVNGCTGRMGSLLTAMIESGRGGHELAAGVDPACPSGLTPGRYASLDEFRGEADMVIDFSHHSAARELTAYCVRRSLPLVVATTGHTEQERACIREAAEHIAVFFSANLSLGVAALVSLTRQAARLFPDAEIEIIERHHNRKLDVPSGTALMLFDAVRQVRPGAEAVVGRHENGRRKPQEVGIHSLRYGSEAGTHEVIVSTGSETLTLRHEAEDRALFAEGALEAAAFLQGKAPGLYSMTDLMNGGRE